MTDPDSAGPEARGRRTLPGRAADGPSAVPRHGFPAKHPAAEKPRRAVQSGEDDRGTAPTTPWFRRRSGWAAAGVAAVVLVPVAWFALLPPPEGQLVAPPPPASPTRDVPTPSPTKDVSGNGSTPTLAPPLPGTASPGPVITAPVEPAPTGGSTVGLVELNDAQFAIPEGWTLYGDELIEGDRRAVRLSHAASDARLQAVTLVPESTDLSASCASLVDLQQTQFTNVSRQLVVPIGVDVALGAGVRCGFSGTRSSDGVPTTVTFTLISRATDAHVLMVRSTVPDAGAGDTEAVLQLNSMTCQASASFGVPQPLC